MGGGGDAAIPVEREGLKRLARHELEKETCGMAHMFAFPKFRLSVPNWPALFG